jgi:hypothetical protein
LISSLHDPLFEALVPQVNDLKVWSFPARSIADAARKAGDWCLRAGWLGADGTGWCEPVDFALRQAGSIEWVWYQAKARIEIQIGHYERMEAKQ